MQEKDKSLVIERIIKYAKWIRIFYIISFVFIAIATVIILFLIAPSLSLYGSSYAAGATTIGLISLLVIGIALMIQIYFFNYYGKVIKNSQNGQYTSATPAMVNFVLIILSILSSFKNIADGNYSHLLSLALTIFTAFLVFSIYKGLKEIKDTGYFDQPIATEYAPDYTVDYQNETTTTFPEKQAINSAGQIKQNDTWIKED